MFCILYDIYMKLTDIVKVDHLLGVHQPELSYALWDIRAS
jgi:hypothetical protein